MEIPSLRTWQLQLMIVPLVVFQTQMQNAAITSAAPQNRSPWPVEVSQPQFPKHVQIAIRHAGFWHTNF